MTSLCIVDDVLFTASRDVDNAMIAWELDSAEEVSFGDAACAEWTHRSVVQVEGEILQSGHTAGISALCGTGGRIFSGGLKGELREWLFYEDKSGCVFEGHFQVTEPAFDQAECDIRLVCRKSLRLQCSEIRCFRDLGTLRSSIGRCRLDGENCT